MIRFLGVFASLLLLSGGIAHACPATTSASTSVSLPPLSPVGVAGGMYYCAASAAPQTVGDLSVAEWARHVQICTTNCSYEAMSPSDPHSLLIATSCGPGWHDMTFLVQPPPPPPRTVGSLHIATHGCSAIAPSKAPPPPAAAASPKP